MITPTLNIPPLLPPKKQKKNTKKKERKKKKNKKNEEKTLKTKIHSQFDGIVSLMCSKTNQHKT